MARVHLDNVVKRYPNGVLGVAGVSLDIHDGEFLALLGPSGCGKTSTMRMIAGLEDITSGDINIAGHRVNDQTPAERNVAMAFENYGLYPHMSLFDNIAYPLRVRKVSPDQVDGEVMRISGLLHIEDVLDSKPKEVSGGVQQRVSLARALVRQPSVFLLDEPLSHLDADLRGRMRGELKRLHELGGATTIYVTHDQLEAMTMSDRIAIMNQGKLQQVGTPAEVFYLPANRFVASFIGEPAMNIVRGQVMSTPAGAAVTIGGGLFTELSGDFAAAVLKSSGKNSDSVDVGVRPPDFEMQPEVGAQGLPARVRVREFLGENILFTLDVEEERVRVVTTRSVTAGEGDSVTLLPRADRIHFFDCDTGQAIGHTGGAAEVRAADRHLVAS